MLRFLTAALVGLSFVVSQSPGSCGTAGVGPCGNQTMLNGTRTPAPSLPPSLSPYSSVVPCDPIRCSPSPLPVCANGTASCSNTTYMNNTKPSGPPTVSPYSSSAPSRSSAPSPPPSSSPVPSRSPDPSFGPSPPPSSSPAPSFGPSPPPSSSPAPSRSVDRSPVPSHPPIPSPVSSVPPTARVYFFATPSALPSHWPVPAGTAGTTAPTTPLSVSFAITGANGTALVQGPLLQQLQAALGCTFQVPLENVALKNVTSVYGGVGTPIPFDRNIPTLNSNGTVVCLVPLNGGRLLHARRVQTSTVVVIGVEILSPSASLVLLNATELNALLEDSTVLQLVSVASGGSGLSLVSASSQGSGVTVAPPAPGVAVSDTTSSPNTGLLVGLSVLSGFCVAIAGVVVGLYHRSRKQPIRSRMILVENAFSEPSVVAKRSVPEDRVEFSPLSIRQPMV